MWLGQNTNHFPLHPAVRQALHDAIDDESFNAYAPPLGMEALRPAIVADLGVPGQSAVVTDGAVSALALACRAFCRGRQGLRDHRPGLEVAAAVCRQGRLGEVTEIPIYGPEYRLQAVGRGAQGRRRLSGHRGHLPRRPEQPAGHLLHRSPRSKPSRRSPSESGRACWSTTAPTATSPTGHYPALKASLDNVVVSMSFSKWLGLAGLRIGAFIAAPALAAEIASWSTGVLGASVVAQRAALAGLSVKAEWMGEVLRINKQNQELVVAAVKPFGFTVRSIRRTATSSSSRRWRRA